MGAGPLIFKSAPMGAVYVLDMYEQRIDHASHYQRVHKESGRIWRISAKGLKPTKPLISAKASDDVLLEYCLQSSNRWHRQTAL